MKRLLFSFSFLVLAFIAAFPAMGQMPYDPGDWTSYRDFRYARSVDAGTHEVFVATSGGILEYEIYRQRWLDPITVGYGLSEAVQLDDPMVLLFDEQTGYLWVATRTQFLQYDVNGDRWTIVSRNLWGIGDRPVNIGVGGNDIFLETIPAAAFANTFLPGSPLPTTNWLSYATRFKGSRSSGGMMLDLAQTMPEGIRWRGLRSKVPLGSDDLYGNLGTAPVNFPTLLLTSGWMWNPDGSVLDPYLRAYPVTDWIVDGRANFWATYWGAGVLMDNLRGGRPEFYQAGPAGDDVRSILIEHDNVWVAGINTGEHKGIARASTNLRDWQTYETRNSSRIRSTDVFDMAGWNGDTWFATDDGLLSFRSKDESWKLYSINQHLQSDNITALAVADTELWIGTSDGLSVMTSSNREVFRIANQGSILSDITRLALCGDTLYIGTRLGLFKGDVRDRHFTYSNLDPTIVNATVTGLSVIASEVWVATINGVTVYDQVGGKSKSFQLNWTGGYVPTSIHAGSEFVWVGTPSGLYRYRRATGEWISYTTKDGLIDDRVQVIKPAGDDLLIGTASGLTRFYWNRPDRNR